MRTQWVRWLFLPLVVLACGHGGWTLYLGWSFESRIKELRANGAPVSFADLAPKPITDEDNAAPLLAEADRWYEKHLLSGEAARDDYEILTWMGGPEDEVGPLLDSSLAELREWLASGDPYVQLLTRAAERPRLQQDLDWDAGIAMEVPTGPQLLRARRFLEQRIIRARRATAREVRELIVMLDLARKVERHSVIQVKCRWAIEGNAADALEELSRKEGFDARAARSALDARFTTTEDASLLIDALRGERAAGVSFARRWIEGKSPIRMWQTAERQPDDAPAEADYWFYSDAVWGSWLARPLAYRDGLQLLRLMDAA